MEESYKIGILGLGYVGLPLALSFSEKYHTIGFDINSQRVNSLKQGEDNNSDISSDYILKSNLFITNNLEDIKLCNIYIITVPTPVDAHNIPDLSILLEATKMVASILKKDDIVIYESTVYPGVTEEECVPVLEKFSQLRFNLDFYCGYSPERISPGDTNGVLSKIIKLTSGSTEEVADVINRLYSSVIDAGTYKAPSIRIAEAAKVVENTQRDVNIALINELAMMFDAMKIPSYEVFKAANTKWNFLDFKPGLVGGHCIGVDPYYLTYKSEKFGYKPNLILSSRQINDSVPSFIVEKVFSLLTSNEKSIFNAEILIFGYTFKENCTDTRNTKVSVIVEKLQKFGCKVDIYDPYLHKEDTNFIKDPFNSAKKYDVLLLAVAHQEFFQYTKQDYNSISKGKLVLLDIKGIVENPTWRF